MPLPLLPYGNGPQTAAAPEGAAGWVVPAPTTNQTTTHRLDPVPGVLAWTVPAPTVVAGSLTQTPASAAAGWVVSAAAVRLGRGLGSGGGECSGSAGVGSGSGECSGSAGIGTGDCDASAAPTPAGAAAWVVPAPTVVQGAVAEAADSPAAWWVVPVPAVVRGAGAEAPTALRMQVYAWYGLVVFQLYDEEFDAWIYPTGTTLLAATIDSYVSKSALLDAGVYDIYVRSKSFGTLAGQFTADAWVTGVTLCDHLTTDVEVVLERTHPNSPQAGSVEVTECQ